QPAFVGVADRLQAQDEGLAFFDLHFRVEVGIESVPERDAGDDRQVAVLLAGTGVVVGGAGEQQSVERLSRLGLEPGSFVARPCRMSLQGRTPLERARTTRLRPTTRWYAEVARQEADDRVGYVEAARVGGELLRVGPDRHEMQGEVSHHLARRRDLDA